MNNGALNTDFEYFENGAIYELTFENKNELTFENKKDNKVLKLIGVYCDDKLHNFTFCFDIYTQVFCLKTKNKQTLHNL